MPIKTLLFAVALLSLSCTTEKESFIEITSTKELEYLSVEEWHSYETKMRDEDSDQQNYIKGPNQILEDEISQVILPRFKADSYLAETVDKLNKTIKERNLTKIPILIHPSHTKKGVSKSIGVHNMPLTNILNIICREHKVKWLIREGRIIFGNFKFNDIKEKRIYQLSNDFALFLKGKR